MPDLSQILSQEAFVLVGTLLAGILLSIATNLISSHEVTVSWINRVTRKKVQETYIKRLDELMENLKLSSLEVDKILNELTLTTKEREATIAKLSDELTKLEVEEKQLQQRVYDLQQLPIPVAEHFAKLLEKGEKRSAARDYILFGSGVVLSAVVSILLRLAGVG